MSLKQEYFIKKVLWGILFVISGVSKLEMKNMEAGLLKNVLFYIPCLVFASILIVEFILRKRKAEAEVEDELAVLNNLKAKAFIYKLIFVIIFIYLVFGSSFELTVNVGVAFIVLGIFQILEYFMFDFYEKKDGEA